MLKPAGVRDIKKDLQLRDRKSLEEFCLRLGKFKKENKELISYLLFWSEDEREYIREIQITITEMMGEVNTSNVYYAKKTIRKVVRQMNRYIRYSGVKTTEIEVRLYFCKEMNELPLDWKYSKVMRNLYNTQIGKIEKAMEKIHEDLQRDYMRELEEMLL